jgi:hypothetical protein
MKSAFKILHEKYEEMNFPNISLEDSISHWKAKQILHNAMAHVLFSEPSRYWKPSIDE